MYVFQSKMPLVRLDERIFESCCLIVDEILFAPMSDRAIEEFWELVVKQAFLFSVGELLVGEELTPRVRGRRRR